MRPLARLAAVALLALSCSHKTPEEQLVKSVDAAASWVPALQMTAEKWTANSVPSTFAASAARAAEKELEKARHSVAGSDAKRELRDRLAEDFRAADAFARRLDDAVSHDDPRRIAPHIRELPPLKNDLDAVQMQYGGGS